MSRMTDTGIVLGGEDLRIIQAACRTTGETVSEFVNRVIVEMLDRTDPYWRHHARVEAL